MIHTKPALVRQQRLLNGKAARRRTAVIHSKRVAMLSYAAPSGSGYSIVRPEGRRLYPLPNVSEDTQILLLELE